MTDQINLEELLDSLWGDIENREIVSDTCVVDEDARCAQLFSDLYCGSIHRVRVGHVAFDIMGHV